MFKIRVLCKIYTSHHKLSLILEASEIMWICYIILLLNYKNKLSGFGP
jgi:hypothetical protein